MMNEKAHLDKNVNGSIIQTLDVFDFSVVHLSWYERLQKRYARQMQIELKIARSDKKRLLELHSTVAIEDSIEFLKIRALKQRDSNYLFPVPELNRTVAVMPFLASDMGAGHSKLWNRYADICGIVSKKPIFIFVYDLFALFLSIFNCPPVTSSMHLILIT